MNLSLAWARHVRTFDATLLILSAYCALGALSNGPDRVYNIGIEGG